MTTTYVTVALNEEQVDTLQMHGRTGTLPDNGPASILNAVYDGLPADPPPPKYPEGTVFRNTESDGLRVIRGAIPPDEYRIQHVDSGKGIDYQHWDAEDIDLFLCDGLWRELYRP